MTAILAPLLLALGPAAVLLVMAVVFVESGLLLGFFLPGDSLLFMTGALIAGQVISLPFWLVALAVFVAAVAGDQLGYLIGRRYGPRVFARPDGRFFRREHADRAAAFFERFGSVAVVLARFVPVVRTFGPMTAGIGRMPRTRFTVYNAVGGVLWAVGILAVGFTFGGIPFVAHHIELITMALAAGSVLPVAVGLLRRRRDGSRDVDSAEGDTSTLDPTTATPVAVAWSTNSQGDAARRGDHESRRLQPGPPDRTGGSAKQRLARRRPPPASRSHSSQTRPASTTAPARSIPR